MLFRSAKLLIFVGGAIHLGLQYSASSVLAGEPVGIINGLPPATGIGSHDGRNDIDQLGHTGDLHAVGMAQQGNQHGANQQCILEIINIFQLMGRLRPALQLLIVIPGMIPHVPLVKGQVDGLLAVFLGLDVIADIGYIGNKPIHVQVVCQECGGIMIAVAIIGVQRNVVHAVIAVIQHSSFPITEGGHTGIGAAADHQLDAGY